MIDRYLSREELQRLISGYKNRHNIQTGCQIGAVGFSLEQPLLQTEV